ncbi:phage holin family protein [Pseudescherichia vulneris]
MVGASQFRDVIFLDKEILAAVVGISAWGGLVRYIVLRNKVISLKDIPGVICQMIVSCFTGMLLSIFVLSRNAQDDKLLLVAGLGGLFAGPLITLLGKKLAKHIEKEAGPILLNPEDKKNET